MRKLLQRLRTRTALFSLAGVLVGIVLAVGGFATIEATDGPEFCGSCHVMEPFTESFAQSQHAALNCNDCHAPTDSYVAKTAFKARAGASHIWYNFVAQDSIPDVIQAKPQSIEAIDQNCYDCHAVTLQQVGHDVKDSCTDCHRSVPHGHSIQRPDEWHEPMHADPQIEPEAAR